VRPREARAERALGGARPGFVLRMLFLK
jgi:hypothetical protein